MSADDGLRVRAMVVDDLDLVDSVMRVAFGTMRDLPDPIASFGDADLARTRFQAAPDCAWTAELDGEVVGSAFATHWGSFGFLGPLSVRPDLWGRGVGTALLGPVLEAFARWDVRQAGLFTFAGSLTHLRLYQKQGFGPGSLTLITAKMPDPSGDGSYDRLSEEPDAKTVVGEVRALTDEVFPGLDISGEIAAANARGLGETILLRGLALLDGVAVCHVGAGSEAGSDACYVKFAAARPGDGAGTRFERLLDACEAFAVESAARRLSAGVSAGRVDAYRRMFARGFRTERMGVSMWLRPDEPRIEAAADYVVNDLR